MKPELCPLKFEARVVPKIWGGRRLAHWGKKLPPDGAVGETWEVFDDEQGSPLCTEGPAAGFHLAELAKAWGRDLMGLSEGGAEGRFPLLIKLLDAREDLSVQVHPDNALARELHGPGASGKSEMWVVLEALEGARVLNGFKPGLSAKLLMDAISKGGVDGLLQEVKVKAGDVIDVPAGRVHAIGAGCLVAEVQQNSDLTYRVWDYGRLENGKPRALHLQEAERALRFDALGCGNGLVTPLALEFVWGLREQLVSNEFFRVERWRVDKSGAPIEGGWPRVIFPLSGSLRLGWGAGLEMSLEAGQVAMLPAALHTTLEPGAAGSVFLCIEPR